MEIVLLFGLIVLSFLIQISFHKSGNELSNSTHFYVVWIALIISETLREVVLVFFFIYFTYSIIRGHKIFKKTRTSSLDKNLPSTSMEQVLGVNRSPINRGYNRRYSCSNTSDSSIRSLPANLVIPDDDLETDGDSTPIRHPWEEARVDLPASVNQSIAQGKQSNGRQGAQTSVPPQSLPNHDVFSPEYPEHIESNHSESSGQRLESENKGKVMYCILAYLTTVFSRSEVFQERQKLIKRTQCRKVRKGFDVMSDFEVQISRKIEILYTYSPERRNGNLSDSVLTIERHFDIVKNYPGIRHISKQTNRPELADRIILPSKRHMSQLCASSAGEDTIASENGSSIEFYDSAGHYSSASSVSSDVL